jgi:hypothetical protein
LIESKSPLFASRPAAIIDLLDSISSKSHRNTSIVKQFIEELIDEQVQAYAAIAGRLTRNQLISAAAHRTARLVIKTRSAQKKIVSFSSKFVLSFSSTLVLFLNTVD